jgi:hypothetical protein
LSETDDTRKAHTTMIRYLQIVCAAMLCLTAAACAREQPAADTGHTGIAAFAPAQRPRGGVPIEIAVFSGRPNPQWVLSESDSQALWAMLAALKPIAAGAAPEGLGYQGFRLRFEQPATGAPGELAIFNGIVHYHAGQQVQNVSDPERRVERWLATIARQHLAFSDYMALPAEVRASSSDS